MSDNKLATVIFAIGFLLSGYALGYYFGSPDEEYWTPPPAPAPQPQLSPYEGTPPQAEFERPNRPRGALAAASSPETADSLLGVLADRDTFSRAVRLATLLDSMGAEDVPEVRDALRDYTLDHDGLSITLLTAFWARHDPSRAAWFALRGGVPKGFSTTAVLTAVYEHARVDPQATRSQIEASGLVPMSNAATAENTFVRGWFDSGEPGLEEYIADKGHGKAEQRALAQFVRLAVLRDGPEGISRWLESLPDTNHRFKLNAFRQGARAIAVVDPAAGLAFCATHCDGPYGDGMRGKVAQVYAMQDGPAAMAWVAGSEPGPQREDAVVWAFEGWWGGRDRSSLNAWLDEMGTGGVEPWFEPVLDLIANSQAGRDPEGAMEWAAKINDETKRMSTMITVARVWGRSDAKAADAWIDQSPLDEAARGRAREQRDRPQRRQHMIHKNPVP